MVITKHVAIDILALCLNIIIKMHSLCMHVALVCTPKLTKEFKETLKKL